MFVACLPVCLHWNLETVFYVLSTCWVYILSLRLKNIPRKKNNIIICWFSPENLNCLKITIYWSWYFCCWGSKISLTSLFCRRSDVFAGSVFWWNISHFWYRGHFIRRQRSRGPDRPHGVHFSKVCIDLYDEEPNNWFDRQCQN